MDSDETLGDEVIGFCLTTCNELNQSWLAKSAIPLESDSGAAGHVGSVVVRKMEFVRKEPPKPQPSSGISNPFDLLRNFSAPKTIRGGGAPKE